MKTDCTRGIKRKIALLVIMALIFSGVPFTSHATSSTRQEIADKENEKDQIEDQIDASKEEISGLKGEQKNLRQQLSELNEQLTAVSDHLAELEVQIRDKEQEIANTTQALAEAREREAWQYDCMEKRIQYAYERGQESLLEIFFSWDSFSRYLNLSTYTESIAAADDDMLDQIIETREFIESEETRLQQEKEALDYLKIQAEADKSRVSGLISQTSNRMADYADQIDHAEEEARAYEANLV